MNHTAIEWCDMTWNPITGCSQESVGCLNCYAKSISRRFNRPWGSTVFHEDRLGMPAKQRPFQSLTGWAKDKVIRRRKDKGWPDSMLKSKYLVFVCSMSDLGHPSVREAWRYLITTVMHREQQHQYIVLTKRPGAWLRSFGSSVWKGVTCETQALANVRMNSLYDYTIDGDVWFASVEPMLEPITFATFSDSIRPKWVICGPENGPSARECDPQWIESLSSESPTFFDKRKNNNRREFPS